jgi:CDP-diacylglycerol--glycerol-3-phosphate 3-phosphatidyltransferase/CDP-diacylglycerol--inositol 3-phosphatidyltransferase
VVTAFVFGDIMDGYMARKTGQSSRWGAFLDSTLDRFGDAAIFGGLVLYYAQSDAKTDLGGPGLYLCLSLVCLVLGNITSYARARAESLGMKAKGGIAERADRLVAILVMTGLNGLFNLPFLTEITLWALTAASAATIVQRMVMVHGQAAGKALGGE